ncbi:MAG: hypothetical protein HY259_10835 [Chloroflexi bacterium]|nr:hypothetical protein [Chloroflexota bacterium]MBI3733934.1 hypothetical protein [Chloroflexota bacterium]
METQQGIDGFFNFIEDQRQECIKLPEHLSSILLVVLLDTLAKCAYPKETENRKRFVQLIDRYSDWKYKDRVSLLILNDLLSRPPASKHQELKRFVENTLGEWPHHRILRPEEADPLKQDLYKLQPDQDQDKLIERARYASLLWVYRNFRVHEFRQPALGGKLSKDNSTPYYLGVIPEILVIPEPIDEDKLAEFCASLLADIEADSDSLFLPPPEWQFYIPPEVIASLVETCSVNLKAYFREKNRNPYDSFKFGSSWFIS